MTRKAKHTPKTPTLRPCREVIQQIQWDPRIHLDAYTIHYEERFTGLRAASLAEFLHKSEIPWHRIRRITTDAQIVWDRDQRIDIISTLLSGTHTDEHAEPAASEEPTDSTDTVDTIATIEHLPVYQSALVLLPPESCWAPIQAIRKAHDPSFVRWMPHINILYGFLPDTLFDEAAALIRAALQEHQIQPFTLSLREIHTFQHKKSTTLWLQPESTVSRAIHAIQEAILPHFPLCNEQARKSDAGFTPHLTIAKIPHHATAIQNQRQWQQHWKPIHFDVTKLHLISRIDDQPFAIKHTIPFPTTTPNTSKQRTQARKETHPGTQTADTTPETNTPFATAAAPHKALSLAANKIDKIIRDAWQTLVEQEQWMYLCEGESKASVLDHTLLWYGSHALDVALPGSDMDLLCIAPEGHSPQEVLAQMAALLSSIAPDSTCRIVEDAFVPALKMQLAETALELACAQLPLGLWGHNADKWHKHFAALPDADRRALQGPLDALIIRQLIHDHAQTARFRALLQHIKQWAQARCIDHQAFGYVGGISWAVLAAWHCLQHRQSPKQDGQDAGTAVEGDFGDLCQSLLAWDWTTPISLPHIAQNTTSPWKSHPRRDRMPILTPSTPHQNTARSITQSTFRVLREEWQRALSLTQAHPQEQQETLLAPANASLHPARYTWSVEAPTPATQAACEGWRKSQCIALLLYLESQLPAQSWAFLRPYPATDNQPLQIGIGLPHTRWQAHYTHRLEDAISDAQHWLTERWEAWKDRPASATSTLALTIT